MEKEKIINICKNLDSQNPIFININKDYTNELISNIEKLKDIKEEKIKTLLCGNSNYDQFTFNQGVAELLVYFLLNKQGIDFSTEKNENDDNESNVDVSTEVSNLKINIEVKSPAYPIHNPKMLTGSFANRFGNKEDNALMMNDLKDKLNQNIEDSNYESVDIQNLTDNKIKDCLLSGQNKFSDPSESCLNVLFLCTTTIEMQSYWQYIVNSSSGFFNEVSDVSSFFADKKQTITLKKEMYDKVSCIVLSNAITLNERKTSEAWDINKAITLVLVNPFCKYYNKKHYRILDSIFKNNTSDFCNGLLNFKEKNPGIPELLYFFEFTSKNGYDVNKEQKE